MEQYTESNNRIVHKKYLKEQSLQQMMLGQQMMWKQKKEVEPLPHTIYKSQFKMDQWAKYKSFKTIELFFFFSIELLKEKSKG